MAVTRNTLRERWMHFQSFPKSIPAAAVLLSLLTKRLPLSTSMGSSKSSRAGSGCWRWTSKEDESISWVRISGESGRKSRGKREKEPRGVGRRTGLCDPSAGAEHMRGGRGIYVPRPLSISSTSVERSYFSAWHLIPTINQRRCKGNKLFSELQVFQHIFFQ